ncbi:MAG TPA: MoaD/ThiS family protein [Anaerolineales bacterium]|jgi:molybdopterin converting factor small subunit
MPVIRIPAPLRTYTGGNKDVHVTGATVAEALTDLSSRHPDIRPHLFKESGELRAFVNVFKGQDNTLDLQGLQTPLVEADFLRVVPSVAGG